MTFAASPLDSKRACSSKPLRSGVHHVDGERARLQTSAESRFPRFRTSFVGRATRDDIGYYYAFDGRPEAEGTQLLGAARIGSGELTSRMLK